MSDEEAEATAALFKALSEPARVKILNLLAQADKSVCVCEIVPALGLSQPTVSGHLKRLAEAGLIEREERGKWSYFSLKPQALVELAALADLKGVAADEYDC